MKMAEPKSLISYQQSEYGCVRVKLSALLDSRGITRNRLQTLTGVKYAVIDRYYKGDKVAMADLDFLAKVCYTLGCKIEDILEYEPPANQ
jgi:putative transcriptional regulator